MKHYVNITESDPITYWHDWCDPRYEYYVVLTEDEYIKLEMLAKYCSEYHALCKKLYEQTKEPLAYNE